MMYLDDLLKRNVLFCSYGRSAIYLALLAIDVKNKDVIVPTLTCNTNILSAIKYAGGNTIFVDIKKNLDIDEHDLIKKLSNEVAVVIIHCYFGGIPSNLQRLSKILASKNIKVLLDVAHSWGYDLHDLADVTIYSFSKSFINPGGGACEFKEIGLFEKAKKIQYDSRKCAHSMVVNAEVFHYMKMLAQDRHMMTNISYNPVYSIFRVFSKLLRCLHIYSKQDFYETLNKINYGIYDTRITFQQLRTIKDNLKHQDILYSKRSIIASKLKKYIAPYIENSTWMTYTLLVDEIETAQDFFKQIDIKTRRVWPAHQKYSNNQLTSNVIYIRDHLLLLDIDNVTEYQIQRMEDFKINVLSNRRKRDY